MDEVLDMREDREVYKERMLKEIRQQMKRKPYRLWWAAAAAALLVACIGYATLDKSAAPVQPALATDIQPGKTGALLTLANGKAILLDTARNGQLASAVVKTNTALTVAATGESETAYNTLTTPRARQEQLVLSD